MKLCLPFTYAYQRSDYWIKIVCLIFFDISREFSSISRYADLYIIKK
jgi:hypothetical protein